MIRSHSRNSHSILKSVPKMGKKRRIIKIFNGEEYRMYEGYGTESRGPIKKMHKKKRRQAFKNELRGII